MTFSPKPQSLPRLAPAQVAARTAYVNAGMSLDLSSPTYRLMVSYLEGEATFFGQHMFESTRAMRNIETLISSMGIDVDAMVNHFDALPGV